MSKSLAAVSLVLMLLTGLVIGQFATLASAWPAPALDSSAASLRGAHEFYEAINDLLATGNSADLRSALSPEFADHSLFENGPATGADLERYFDSLRLASPGLMFSATAVLREPGVVAVTISSETTTVEEEGRSRLDVRNSLPTFDLLRLSGSKVVERWSFPVAPRVGSLATLAMASIGQGAGASGFILERFTLEPFEQLDFLHVPGIVILPEGGRVTCESVAMSSLEQLQDTRETCRGHPGSEIIIEAGRSIRLRNPGPGRATLVVFRLLANDVIPGNAQPLPDDSPHLSVNSQTLALGSFDQDMRGQLGVVVQEVHLEPGNGVAEHSVSGEEVVLATTGEIRFSGHGWVAGTDGQVTAADLPISSTAGNAIYASDGSRLAYQNPSESEAIVLVFSVASMETTVT